jgi:protein TonB
MAPMAKENEVLTAPAEAARRSAPAVEAAAKTQAVALELPVSVNGARTVDGSDKREPFSEATKTVLVFGNGAVIRLQVPVAPGQLLFLTNENTKKEVVCQVVKSKNYRNVSGYVELEFTEPVVGFWGMRFPSDRIGPAAPVAGPAATPQPPLASRAPQAPPAARPDAAANFNALKALTASSALSELPTEPVKAANPISNTGANTSAPLASTRPAATTAASPVTPQEAALAVSHPTSDALKQQTARLQEQLSSMAFTEKPREKAKTETVAPNEAQETAAKVLEFAKAETPRAATQTPVDVQPRTVTPSAKQAQQASNPSKSPLEAEEVKIPSWLEPLARNAAAVSAAEAPPLKEEHPFKELPIFSTGAVAEPLADSAPPAAETDSRPFNPTFLVAEEEPLTAPPSRSSKGILIGTIAAGLVVGAAGLAWYLRNQSGSSQLTAAAAITSPATVAQTPPQSLNTSAPISSLPAGPQNPASTTNTLTTANVATAIAAAKVNSAVAKTPQPAPPQAPIPVPVQPSQKKPALGNVHLAAPNVNGKRGKSVSADEPGIAFNGSEAPASANLGALASTKQPEAPEAPAEPRPVGGDVTPAKLLSSVGPVYPQLAKNQRVSGDVKMDALIDATGRVTTMKVVSGPALLHQAAMEALRQWKYQPAKLDGKPVSMHLTVTLQFRLQ